MSTFYESTNDYRSYLSHHGVKGMKWGVRHEREKKARKMRKHGITSEEYDKIKSDTKKVMKPVRGIMTGIGGLQGLATAQGIRKAEALKEGARAFKRSANTAIARRGSTDVTTWASAIQGRPLASSYLTDSIIGQASSARNAAIKKTLNNPVLIATLPIGAAVGTAAGAVGGKILEEIIANNEMRTAGQRRDRRYN